MQFVHWATVPIALVLTAGIPVDESAVPERVFDLPITLHVRDAASRAELTDVEIRCQSKHHWSAHDAIPPRLESVAALIQHAVSPVVLRSWRYGSDPIDYVRGYAVRGATDATEHEVGLGNGDWASRGLVAWANAPGYASKRIEFHMRTGGDFELGLFPGAALRLHFEHLRVADYSALQRTAWLNLSASGYSYPVSENRIDSEFPREDVLLDGLPVGAMRVSVQLGDPWEHRDELGGIDVELRPHETREAVLVLDEPPAPSTKARIAGTLTFPAGPDPSSMSLEFYDIAEHDSEADAVIPLSAMTASAARGQTYAFETEALPVGRYQVKLFPVLEDWFVDLPAEGNSNVRLAIDVFAEVVVRTVDPNTGAVVPAQKLFFSPVQLRPCAERVNHVGQVMNADPSPGHFRFFVTPGPIDLTADSIDGLAYGYSGLQPVVPAGFSNIDFPLAMITAMRFVVRQGGVVLPVGQLHMDLGRRCEGPGQGTIDRTASAGILEFDKPGTYTVRLPTRGSQRFKQVSPLTVELKSGEITDVVIDLEDP